MSRLTDYVNVHCWPSVVGGALIVSLLGAVSLARTPEQETVLDFTDMQDWAPSDLFARFEGWKPGPNGLVGTKDERCFLSFPIAISRFQNHRMVMELAREGSAGVKMSLLVPFSTKSDSIKLPKQKGTAPPWRFSFGPSWKEIDASMLVDPERGVNLLQVCPWGGSCVVGVSSDGSSDVTLKRIRIITSPTPVAWLMFPMATVLILTAAWHAATAILPERSLSLVVVCFGVLAIQAWMVPAGILELIKWAAVLFALAGLLPALLGLRRQSSLTLVLLLITFLGACLRWEHLNQMQFESPAPDAVRYRQIANEMMFLYDTQEREPLFILCCKISLLLFGDSDTSLRILTFILSIALIPAIYKVGKELFGIVPGLVSAMLLAGCTDWAWSGSRGMRLELFTLVLMPMTWAIFTDKVTDRKRHGLLLAASTALTCAVRLTSLWFCLAGCAYAIWRRGWDTRVFAKVAGLAVLPLLPFVIYCGVKFGDPMHTANIHAKWYRNYELVGVEGGITEAQMIADPYGGPKVSSFDFFFRQHTPLELATRTIRAFTSIFFGTHMWTRAVGENYILYWLAVASYVIVAASPHRLLLFWTGLLVGPIAWLFGDSTAPEARLVMHTSAMVYLFMGLSVDWCLRRAGWSLSDEVAKEQAVEAPD